MGRLIYSSIGSLDGYVADSDGNFDWAAPDEEVHRAVNDVVRPAGTYLFGRRMYEPLSVWDDLGDLAARSPAVQEYAAIWKTADKVVYSRSLEEPMTTRTRIERDFDAEAVRRMKEGADRDLTVGGPDLAGQALGAGLVDELQLFVVPVVVGGGTRWLPQHVRLGLELLNERRFAHGVVQLHYRVEASESR